MKKRSHHSLKVSNRQLPTYPNNQASGLIKGQKIVIKDKPNNYNILGDFNLRTHFLKKLEELRSMKAEYYCAPYDPNAMSKRVKSVEMPDPVEETASVT